MLGALNGWPEGWFVGREVGKGTLTKFFPFAAAIPSWLLTMAKAVMDRPLSLGNVVSMVHLIPPLMVL